MSSNIRPSLTDRFPCGLSAGSRSVPEVDEKLKKKENGKYKVPEWAFPRTVDVLSIWGNIFGFSRNIFFSGNRQISCFHLSSDQTITSSQARHHKRRTSQKPKKLDNNLPLLHIKTQLPISRQCEAFSGMEYVIFMFLRPLSGCWGRGCLFSFRLHHWWLLKLRL